jgi:hypothetical protein
MNWNKPEAPDTGLYAAGSPRLSHCMTVRASSTRSIAKTCSTSERHSSTSRGPPSSGGIVVVVVGGSVVVGGGAVVVVGGGGGAVVVVAGGTVVVVVLVVVVVVVVVVGVGAGVGSTRGVAATSTTTSAGDSATADSISGLSAAANEAAATRADRDVGRTPSTSIWGSASGLLAETAANPTTAIKTTMITPAAET